MQRLCFLYISKLFYGMVCNWKLPMNIITRLLCISLFLLALHLQMTSCRFYSPTKKKPIQHHARTLETGRYMHACTERIKSWSNVSPFSLVVDNGGAVVLTLGLCMQMFNVRELQHVFPLQRERTGPSAVSSQRANERTTTKLILLLGFRHRFESASFRFYRYVHLCMYVHRDVMMALKIHDGSMHYFCRHFAVTFICNWHRPRTGFYCKNSKKSRRRSVRRHCLSFFLDSAVWFVYIWIVVIPLLKSQWKRILASKGAK